MIIESEKTEADHSLETIRIRNEELRKKYEQLIMDNDHRIHLEDHIREMNEMKRLTGLFHSLFYLFIFFLII
jgi:hypothetical protein